jgi:hypothetical protein
LNSSFSINPEFLFDFENCEDCTLGYIEPGKPEGMTEDERHALTLYWKNGKVATTTGGRKANDGTGPVELFFWKPA